jgi:hypothetical protein
MNQKQNSSSFGGKITKRNGFVINAPMFSLGLSSIIKRNPTFHIERKVNPIHEDIHGEPIFESEVISKEVAKRLSNLRRKVKFGGLGIENSFRRLRSFMQNIPCPDKRARAISSLILIADSNSQILSKSYFTELISDSSSIVLNDIKNKQQKIDLLSAFVITAQKHNLLYTLQFELFEKLAKAHDS